MVLVEDFIESFLEHADPKYYDPVKAHEYYLKTRELSGRTSSLKTETQKQAFAYSKTKIKEAQQAELDTASEKRKASLEKVRATAEQRRKEIRDKLNILLKQLSTTATDKIKALPPIPKGLSKEAAAKAHAKRSEEIAKIREASGAEKMSAREASGAEREQLRGEMKKTLDTARSNYETLKKALKAKYEKETQQEFEAIKQNV